MQYKESLQRDTRIESIETIPQENYDASNLSFEASTPTDPFTKATAMTTDIPLPCETALPVQRHKRNTSIIPFEFLCDESQGGREQAALATVFGVREYSESKIFWGRQAQDPMAGAQQEIESESPSVNANSSLEHIPPPAAVYPYSPRTKENENVQSTIMSPVDSTALSQLPTSPHSSTGSPIATTYTPSSVLEKPSLPDIPCVSNFHDIFPRSSGILESKSENTSSVKASLSKPTLQEGVETIEPWEVSPPLIFIGYPPAIFDLLQSDQDDRIIVWGGPDPQTNPLASPNPAPDPDPPAVVAPKVIEAATVEKLVEKLTSTLDYNFMTDFFLTYRTFISPTQLCKLLILRFRWALENDEENRRVVRVRSASERVQVIAPPPPTSEQERVGDMVRAKLGQSAIRRKTAFVGGVDVGGQHHGNMAVQDARKAPVVVIGSVRNSNAGLGSHHESEGRRSSSTSAWDADANVNASYSIASAFHLARNGQSTSKSKVMATKASYLQRMEQQQRFLRQDTESAPAVESVEEPLAESSQSSVITDYSLESAISPGTTDVEEEEEEKKEAKLEKEHMGQFHDMNEQVRARLEAERRQREEEEEQKRVKFFSASFDAGVDASINIDMDASINTDVDIGADLQNLVHTPELKDGEEHPVNETRVILDSDLAIPSKLKISSTVYEEQMHVIGGVH
ncbi:hypothetical protein BDF14DRAFT_1746979 [Spinellus fusiger]|nr:hypothetical protein BDF14DRAFT_1746979 [Spinellus fusiger]